MKKNKSIIIVTMLFLLLTVNAQAEQFYNPPFELYGEVKTVSSDSLEIYVPHINKQITVMIMSQTLIISRMDEKKIPQKITAIEENDLVQVNGVIKKDSFYCTKISYLSLSVTR
ncbi:MAG: hypothetical protein ABIG64_08435 [Candidatus Omnitrophota bacterium]